MPIPAALAFLANPQFWAGVGKAAGSFAGAGGLSGLFGGGDDEEIKYLSTLSDDQKSMMSNLGTYLQSALSQAQQPYSGQLTAGLSGAEQSALTKAQSNLTGGLTPTDQATLDAYNKALTGMSEKDVYNDYMKYTAPSEGKYLRDVLLPAVKESQVAGGTLRSTGTERGIADTVSNFGNQQLSRIGERIQNERNAARSALSLGGSMSDLESQTSDISTAASMGGIQRAVEQAKLTAEYQDFIRTTPDLANVMNNMLQYLNTTTMAAYAPEDSGDSPFSALGGVLGQLMSK